MLYGFLWFPTCFAKYCENRENNRDIHIEPYCVSTAGAPPRVQANTPSSASTNGAPYISAPPSVSKDLPSHTSTDPPAYVYTAPPSYEAAIADTVE